MISFRLVCDKAHAFEGWFRGNDDFDKQLARDLVQCPVCGSTDISKGLMAPAVTTSRAGGKVALAIGESQREMLTQMQELARKVKETSEDVGERFAEEARKIHYGEADARGIYGEASGEEAKDLLDEGIAVLPLPVLPEDTN